MKRYQLRFRVIAFAILMLAAMSVAQAQLTTGTISGTVQDSTGAVIPGVTISLMSSGVIGGNQQTVTDERGGYQFIRLVPSTYSVKAELSGFRSALRDNVTVNAQVTVRVDLILQVGEVSDTVTVT